MKRLIAKGGGLGLGLGLGGVMLTVVVLSQHMAYAAQMLDRMVLEVNKTAYSQRQIEVYCLIREVSDSPETGPKGVTAKNWRQRLMQFRSEMIVEQEAQRLGTVKPTAKMVSDMLAKISRRRQQSKALNQIYRDLKVSTEELKGVLASLIRVNGFLSSKIRRGPGPLQVTLDTTAPWFVKLQDRTPSRLFAGASIFVRRQWSGSAL